MPNETQLIESLVKEHLGTVYRFVLGFCHDTEEASDLTQEVFLKAWKNFAKFDQNKNFKTWLLTIAKNTVIDWWRKKRPIAFSRLYPEEESPEDNLADPQPLPDELFARAELAHDLAEALEQINPEDKIIILWHHVEEFTFDEIAELMDTPANTIKSRYRRALFRLRKHLV